MTLGNHILEWFPEGTLYSVVHSKLGGQASLKQEILDKNPEEVTADVRALFGRHFPGALKADPLVRVVLEGSEDKQDKQLSAILRWLRGDGRTRLSEYEEARNSLKLYIDFAGIGQLLDDILSAPLPNISGSGSSQSVRHSDPDRKKHPTEVLNWTSFPADVRAVLQGPDVEVWRLKTYAFQWGSEAECIEVTNESSAVSVLNATACARLNFIFKANNFGYAFQATPSTLPNDSQESVPDVPMETIHGDAPDLCLQAKIGIREDVLTMECKTRYRLKDVERHQMAELWTHWSNTGGAVVGLQQSAAYNAVHVISQEYDYMAKRGHRYGVISTFFTTWVLKADVKGKIWISDGIANNAIGCETQVSVSQALLFAALSNINNKSEWKPYMTATAPGLPVETPKDRTRSSKQNRPADQAVRESTGQSSSQKRTLQSPSASVPVDELHLTERLSPSVYLGRVAGTPAAVRVVSEAAAEGVAMREVAAYQRLAELQGNLVPRLLAYGQTTIRAGTAFYVATEFVEGEQWDWHLPKHRELDQALSDVLAAIHSRGVLHGDVHDGNILVTADRRIVIVDFEDAKLQAPATATDAEMHDLSRQLFHPVEAHAH